MCTFHWGVGESLQIEGSVRLYIRSFERDQIWLSMETPEGSKSVVHLITSSDKEEFPPFGPAF